MTEKTQLSKELGGVSAEALTELNNRILDISNSYRSIAEKMGQLYMCADENKVVSLTESLDKPMRNASDNDQSFAALLEEVRAFTSQQRE